MTNPDLVLLEIERGVAHLTLNRPESLNALNLPLVRALQAALDAVAADRSVRAVLLSGAGRHFCAGGDVKWFAELGDRLTEGLKEILSVLNPLLLRLARLPVPVVTSVQGLAAGAGTGIALAGDLVLGGESSKLLCSYTGIGLSPDVGAAYFLARRAGPGRAKEFLFLNRPLPARQCVEWGLFNAVFPDDELPNEAERLAGTLAAGPTVALGLAKRLVDGASGRRLEEQLALEREFMARCGDSRDGREGVRAFLERRPPMFSGH